MPTWPFGGGGEPSRRRSDLPHPPPRPWPRLWIPGVIVGAVVILALIALPQGTAVSDFIFVASALIPLVVLLGATLTMVPGPRGVWWALFAFQALTMAAVAVYSIQTKVLDHESFPGLADVVYLVAYLPAFVALGLLIHRLYPGRDAEAWIDASILTVTATCVFALFLIAPILSSSDLTGVGTLVAIAYPVLDLALLSALVWLLIGSPRPTPTLAMISLSVAITLTADIIRDFALLIDPSGSSTSWLGVLRLLALMIMAAAAWTPTSESFTNPPPRRTPGVTTARLIMLAVGVLTVPSIVAFRLWGISNETNLLLALAAIIIIILAVWRIQILVSAVEQQRRVTELVLDSAGDGIVGLDRDGFVMFANLSARRMLRCRESDLVDHRFHDVAHHERPDGTPLHWTECPVTAHASSGEQAFIADQRYFRRDGSSFPVEILMSPLVIEGVVMGAVQSFRDVSERQHMEEVKRQFVSVVSHELRTPLTSIKGSLQMLDSGVLGGLNDDQQELLTMAVSNSERLGQLVNDILDLERLDAGRMPLEPVDVSAFSLAEQAVIGITGAADAAGVGLAIDITDDSEPHDAHVDPHRMLQVLTNLLGNAVKFSERESTVHVIVTGGTQTVSIAVADHGRGIPEDRLASVFERFGQVESGDARRQGGTGLGLAIAQEIVVRSGGTITVDSVMGEGSTFTVTMPAAHRGHPSPDAPQLMEEGT